MAGVLLSVLPASYFIFTSIDPTGGSVSVVAARRIDVTGYTTAVLGVRVHGASIVNTLDSIQVVVAADGYTPDDAGRDYGAVGTTLAAVTLLQGQPVPDYQTVPFNAASFGGLVQVRVIGTRVTVAGGLANIRARLSLDLWLKCGAQASPSRARMPGCFHGYLPRMVDWRGVEHALPSPGRASHADPRQAPQAPSFMPVRPSAAPMPSAGASLTLEDPTPATFPGRRPLGPVGGQ